jgi:hypothetical protein
LFFLPCCCSSCYSSRTTPLAHYLFHIAFLMLQLLHHSSHVVSLVMLLLHCNYTLVFSHYNSSFVAPLLALFFSPCYSFHLVTSVMLFFLHHCTF